MLEMMVGLRCDEMGMAHRLVVMMMVHALRPKDKAKALLVMLPKVAPTQARLTSLVKCERGMSCVGL
jgi:glycyl-tRNA synthetase (class II)